MQKGFTPILILVGILIITTAGGAYYLGTRKSAPVTPTPVVTSKSPQATPTPDETINWKTYNGKYFSFKYPPEWKTIILPSSQPEHYDPTLENIVLKISSNSSLLISAFDNTEKDAYDTEADSPGVQPIQVREKQAVRFNSSSFTPPTQTFTRIIVKGSDNVGAYAIIFSWDSGYEVSNNLIDQILSTFRFEP